MAPPAIQLSCATPLDDIRYVGMFMSLGVYFAGISVGSSTFGDEKGTPLPLFFLLSSVVLFFAQTTMAKGKRANHFFSVSVNVAVYWRDTSAGMPTLPYYLAKILADVPRMIVAGK